MVTATMWDRRPSRPPLDWGTGMVGLELGLGDGGRSDSVKGTAALGLVLGDGVARALGDGGALAR